MGQKETHEALYRIYKEYRSLSKTPRLSLDLLMNIAPLFISDGRLKEAEEIVARALHCFPQFQKLPTAILKLARAYLRREMTEKGKRCLMLICRRYPESVESRIARGMLKEPI